MKILFLTILFCHFTYGASDFLDDQRTCFENVVAELVDQGTLGGDTGICIKEKIDRNGDITGFDLSLSSDAYILGEAKVKLETAQKVQKITDFILKYENIANKKNLKLNDLKISVRSYADGVAGPSRLDEELKKKDLAKLLAADKKSLSYIQKNYSKEGLNWAKMPEKAKSLLRNVLLGQQRSQAMCQAMGITNCSSKNLQGYASPELENTTKANCSERRVSVISLDLSNSMGHAQNENGIYTPNFGFAENKRDLEIASVVSLIKEANKIENDPKKLASMLPLGCKRSLQEENAYVFYIKKLLNNFKNAKTRLPPEVVLAMQNGDYEVVKKYESSFKGKDAFYGMLIVKGGESGGSSNDFLNCFSAEKAIQHSINHDHAHYGISAEELVGPSSNAQLTIQSPSFSPIIIENGQSRSGVICQQCGSGVYEKDKGFATTFREFGNSTNGRGVDGHTPMKDVVKQFSEVPSSLGGLKTLGTFVITSCENCKCLKEGSLDDLLKDNKRVSRVEYGASKSTQVLNIEDPGQTCIYTPPVAHACSVAPDGNFEGLANRSSDVIPVCKYLLSDTMKSSLPRNFEQIKTAMEGARQNCEKSELKEKLKTAFCSPTQLMESNEVPLSCLEGK